MDTIMNTRSGFTLLELVLFMAIAGVTMGVIVYFLIQINRLSVSNDVATTIDSEGIRIQEELSRQIADSMVILSPDLGQPATDTATFLNTSGNETTIRLDGENLVILESSSTSQLNPDVTNVTSLSFEQIDTESSDNRQQIVQGLRISFDLNYDTPNVNSTEYDYSRTFTFSAYQSLTVSRLTVTDSLDIWLKADEGVTYGAGGVLSNWTDQSGSSVSFSPPTSGTSPTFQSNVTKNYPGIRFDGNDYLALDSVYTPPLGTNARTLVAVLDNVTIQDGVNYNHVIHYGTTGLNQAYGLLTRTNAQSVVGNHYWANNYTSSIPFLTQNSASEPIPQIVMNSYDGTTDRMYLQLDQVESNTIALNTVANEFLIGSRIGGAAEFFQGDILEILVYSKALSDTERKEVYDYLNNKYDVYKTVTNSNI